LEPGTESFVDRVYEQLKAMSVSYEFKPGEKLNEGEIARRLGVSRTPLREALNRLNMEGFLRFLPGKGFYCRELDPREIFDLYELRKSIETSAVQLSVQRAKDDEITALLQFLDGTGPEAGTRSTIELVELDETFHERLMAMCGNTEMLRLLRNVNARIRFVRWIDMDRGDRRLTQAEHREMLLSLQIRNLGSCVAIVEKHIDRRIDQITAAIKEGYAQIYMPRNK
jgi:DNA-binding GntR family transcriptional regulator